MRMRSLGVVALTAGCAVAPAAIDGPDAPGPTDCESLGEWVAEAPTVVLPDSDRHPSAAPAWIPGRTCPPVTTSGRDSR